VSFAKTYTAIGNTVFYAGLVSADEIKGSWILTAAISTPSGAFKMTSRLPLGMEV
jgi:hypothetical protein